MGFLRPSGLHQPEGKGPPFPTAPIPQITPILFNLLLKTVVGGLARLDSKGGPTPPQGGDLPAWAGAPNPGSTPNSAPRRRAGVHWAERAPGHNSPAPRRQKGRKGPLFGPGLTHSHAHTTGTLNPPPRVWLVKIQPGCGPSWLRPRRGGHH